MALTKCKQCGHQVARSAKSCPNCGAQRRGGYKKWLWGTLALSILAAMMLSDPPSDEAVQKQVEARKARDAIRLAECRKSLECWSEEHLIDAAVACESRIERMSNASARWTTSSTTLRFPRAAWVDQSAGTLAYLGESVEFQNQFGAYRRYAYRCAYDPQSRQVTDVSSEPL